MSALVQYDSSSDENDPVVESIPAKASEASKVAVNGTLSDDTDATKPKIDQGTEPVAPGPLLGPSLSTDDVQPYTSYEDEQNDQSQMSERDLIRYLTQATHPMTVMPPSPTRSPDTVTSERFKRFLNLKAKSVHFNEDLAAKKAFKNPSLLATMMERAGLDGESQYRSSLPPDILDVSSFPAFAYKEQLLKSQQSIRSQDEMEKQVQSAAGKRTIDFTSAGTNESSSRSSTPGLQSKRRRP